MYKNVSFSDDDSIIDPPVHDAKILGMLVTSQKKLIISMQLVDGSNVCLVLNDIKRIRSDGFREGNIVLDITIWKGDEVDLKKIAYVHGLETFYPLDSSSYIQQAMHDFLHEERLLVQIEPSYGCKLACICGGIHYLQDYSLEAILTL